jgi:DNA repair protein RecO (recombination protein O)
VEGRFLEVPPRHPQFLDTDLSNWLGALLSTSLQRQENLRITARDQTHAYGQLIEYYSLHLSGFGNVKSHTVLEAVWA